MDYSRDGIEVKQQLQQVHVKERITMMKVQKK